MIEQPSLDGRALGLVWALPFAGILLSIALLPGLAPHFWHRHYGKVAAFWALAFLVPCAILKSPLIACTVSIHTLTDEYLPFTLLLLALFTVGGGVHIEGRLGGAPLRNTMLLAGGGLLASVAGTTGAAMLLIRPFIAANEGRRYRAHLFVFFIILVGNVGGALSPLGDPPLFLGFLQGVPFFWPTRHLLAPMALTSAALLLVFFLLDLSLYRREGGKTARGRTPFSISGKRNILLLPGIIVIVLATGLWDPQIEISLLGLRLGIESLLRDALLIAITLLSLAITRDELRKTAGFSWFPMLETAKLFAGIFITIVPLIAILRAGHGGALGSLVALAQRADGSPDPALYFWLTGGLSSLLDNAPTYLMVLNMAGGDPAALTGPLAQTLMAMLAGAVFMGANSYIGNAPNFMVRSICQERGIAMPSFFAYMGWAALLLLPIYAALTLIFFRP
jgi:Na+/H+ antiporter NhaD/arsenite permease-like protein